MVHWPVDGHSGFIMWVTRGERYIAEMWSFPWLISTIIYTSFCICGPVLIIQIDNVGWHREVPLIVIGVSSRWGPTIRLV